MNDSAPVSVEVITGLCGFISWVDNIHSVYVPEGNGFVFPRILMFRKTKLRENKTS